MEDDFMVVAWGQEPTLVNYVLCEEVTVVHVDDCETTRRLFRQEPLRDEQGWKGKDTVGHLDCIIGPVRFGRACPKEPARLRRQIGEFLDREQR